MNLVLQRYSDNRESTLGVLFRRGEDTCGKKLIKMCYTIEDEWREEKKTAETRIPAGFYEIKWMEEETPLTLKYRKRFPNWFKYHLHITNVKGFTGIYIHLGNTDMDTDGCIVVGDNADNNMLGRGSVSNSVQAFTRIYSEIGSVLDAKKKVFIEIRDEKHLL